MYYFLTFIIFIVKLRSVNFSIKRILDWIGLDNPNVATSSDGSIGILM